MNDKPIWIFKSQKQMIISLIFFILFIMGFVYISTIDFSKKGINDKEKFANEHKAIIDKENVYTYINNQEALTYIKQDNVIILFGVKNNDYVGYYANILNEVAKNNNVEEIYYYDITDDREKKNGTYQSIAEYLSDYVTHLDDGTVNIYGPTLYVKKNGIVIHFDDSNAFISGNMNAEKYWSEYQIGLQKNILNEVLKEYMEM